MPSESGMQISGKVHPPNHEDVESYDYTDDDDDEVCYVCEKLQPNVVGIVFVKCGICPHWPRPFTHMLEYLEHTAFSDAHTVLKSKL
jgi:hypothetical protein